MLPTSPSNKCRFVELFLIHLSAPLKIKLQTDTFPLSLHQKPCQTFNLTRNVSFCQVNLQVREKIKVLYYEDDTGVNYTSK